LCVRRCEYYARVFALETSTHKHACPPPQVQRSLVYLGANQRLRRVVHDMLVGKSVRVGAIGGSITHGAKATKIGETDWFRWVGVLGFGVCAHWGSRGWGECVHAMFRGGV
jgi:hypothetical protein